jgi:hypothetical protein
MNESEVCKYFIYLESPRHLDRRIHDLYFNPQHEEFQPRTLWSLSNAFTSAFKELEPIPQFRATAQTRRFSANGAVMIGPLFLGRKRSNSKLGLFRPGFFMSVFASTGS